MSLTPVVSPYQPINGLTGLGLNNGSLYIGVDGTDPQVSPQACFWDAAGLVPAFQPIPILGGYPMYLGSPGRLYTDTSYSIRVRDMSGAQVFYEAHAVPAVNAASGTFDTLAAAQAASIASAVRAGGLIVLGYYAAGDGGGGQYRYAAAQASGPGKFQSVDGAWWELAEPEPNSKMFGAKHDYSTNPGAGTDDRAALQNFIDFVQSTSKIGTLSGGCARITASLTFDATKSFIIRGVSQDPNGFGPDSRGGSAIYNDNRAGAHAIVCDDTAHLAHSDYPYELSDLTVIGNKLSGDGLHLVYVHRWRSIRLWVTTNGGNGIFTDNCWGYYQQDCICTHNGKYGLWLGRRANANLIIGGGALANGATDGYGNLHCAGDVNYESLGSRVIGFDCSYAGSSPWPGGTVTTSYNVSVQYCWSWHIDVYSEAGIAGFDNIYFGIGTRNLNFTGYVLDGNILSDVSTGLRARVFMQAETRNCTFTGNGDNDTDAKVSIGTVLAGGHTVTINCPSAWVEVPGIRAPPQAYPGPLSAVAGQLWFDTTNVRLKWLDGTDWRSVVSFLGNPAYLDGSRSDPSASGALGQLLTWLDSIGLVQNHTTV